MNIRISPGNKRLRATLALFFCLSLHCAIAEWPLPNAVPNGSAELRATRTRLLAESDRILKRVREHDAACRKVPAGSRQAEDCARQKALILAQIETYHQAVDSFNAEAKAGKNSTAGAQLKSAESHSVDAAGRARRNDETAIREGQKGFDSAGKHADGLDSMTVDGTGYKQDPVVPKELEGDPAIAAAIRKRTEARQKLAKLDEDLKKLPVSDPKNHVEIGKLNDQKQRQEREIQYENYSIGEQIKALAAKDKK